jgi:hypothetical protein
MVMNLLMYMSWKTLGRELELACLLLAFGLFGCAETDPNAPPFELTRIFHSNMGWNTGGRIEWWTYEANWRGRKLSFAELDHRYKWDDGAMETFDFCSDGYALGKAEFSESDSKQQISAEAMLLRMGWDPDNFPRWFLLKESAGKLEATWLATTTNDDVPIWQIWNADHPVKSDDRIFDSSAELGVKPLRSYEMKMALPAHDAPRFLLIGTTALLDVATLQAFHFPAGNRSPSFPLGLSADGDVLMFLASKDEEDGIEQIAWQSGEVRWLPLDKKRRHLRDSMDINRAWRDAALEWKAEKPGATRWAQWRENASMPFLAGSLRGSNYTLEGYRSALLQPALELLKRELHATVSLYVPEYPLAPDELMYSVEIAGSALIVGYNKEHGIYAYVEYKSRDKDEKQAYQTLTMVASTLDNALRAGQWQEFVEP